jgi:hypothetical protein
MAEMYKKMIDDFFVTNGLHNPDFPSACTLANFKIRLMQNSEFSNRLKVITDKFVFDNQPQRKSTALTELAEINSVDSYEKITKLMRRDIDNVNYDALVMKALTFEEELIPDIIKRLKTSLNDAFIEIAIRILALSSLDIADDLLDCFDDIRNPYAQSMILVALGFKASEEHIPQIIEKYHQLKKRYPNETFSDGAIYALYEIEARLFA